MDINSQEYQQQVLDMKNKILDAVSQIAKDNDASSQLLFDGMVNAIAPMVYMSGQGNLVKAMANADMLRDGIISYAVAMDKQQPK